MDWIQALTIIGTLLGAIAWLDHRNREDMERRDERQREAMNKVDERWKMSDDKHTQAMERMDERWKWLFERTDNKLDQIAKK